MNNTMEQNIKQFIEEGEKEFEDRIRFVFDLRERGGEQCNNIPQIMNDEKVDRLLKEFSSRQISLIKMIMEDIEGMKKELVDEAVTMNIEDENVIEELLKRATPVIYNKAVDTITSKLKEIIRNVER